LGERQYRKMLLHMQAARQPTIFAWIWRVRSLLV